MHYGMVRYQGECPPSARSVGAGPLVSATRRSRTRSVGRSGCAGRITAFERQRSFTRCRHKQFDEYELGAILEAGRKAGSYLDEIGKTDLKVLNREEWREFLFRLLTGYEEALRRKLINNEPPLNSPPL